MTEDERRLIDDLFQRLEQAEQQAPHRDRDAEYLVSDRVARRPAAAYYLAQVALVQEHALREAKLRIDDLEAKLRQNQGGASGGQFSGFLGGFSGGAPGHGAAPSNQGFGTAPRQGSGPTPSVPPTGGSAFGRSSQSHYGGLSSHEAARAGAFRHASGRGGGGFLAGAAQTAVGVAGGMVAASLISDMMSGDAVSGAVAGATEAVSGATEAVQGVADAAQGGLEGAQDIVSGGLDLGDFGEIG